MDMTGRTVLVTGASSGIGRATAELLSGLGARLVLVGRDAARLEETLEQLQGSSHWIEQIDLAGLADIPGWLKSLAARTGMLHGLVHAAGVHRLKPLRSLTPQAVDEVMRVNLGAAIQLARGFCQRGVAAAGGSIVFLSSVTGLVGQAGIAAYAASKGAIVALTRALAVELAREGIRVNSIAPGVVRTRMGERLLESLTADQAAALQAMHLLGLGTPVDVAYAVAFLLAETGRWITGTTLVVDGGYVAH